MPSWSRTQVLLVLAGLVAVVVFFMMGREGSELAPVAATTHAEPLERGEPRARTMSPELQPDEGGASIAGRVRTRGGEPIAQARVCAWPRRLAATGPACARTAADGRYTLGALTAGRHRLVATATQHLPGTAVLGAELGLAAGEARREVDFELRPGGVEVHGVVVDELGGPIEGARVWGMHESQSVGGVVTDAEGRFSQWVAPGRWRWHAVASDYAAGHADTAAPGQTIRLTLTPESIIEGRVVEAGSGRALAGVAVMISEGVESGMTSDLATTLARDVSDAEGRFRLAGLLPGRYKPIAIAEGLRGEPGASIRLGLAEHVSDLVIEMQPSATLVARVVLANSDTGCDDGSLLIRHREGEPFEVGMTDPTGHVTLHGLAPGLYDVVARCRDHRPTVAAEPLALVAGRSEERTFSVEPGLELRGTVVEAGAPVEGAQLTLFGGDGATAMIPTTSASDGGFVFCGLEPGSYTVHVSAEPRAEPAPVAVEVDEASAPLTIELPESMLVEGRVIDAAGAAVAGVSVRANADLRSAITHSDDDGHFALALAPGKYLLYANADDGATAPEQTVAVPRTTGLITIELPLRNGTIAGTVVDEEGAPLSDVWVQAWPTDATRPGFAETVIREQGLGGTAPRTLTDAEGHFGLTAVGPGPHTVLAQRRGGGEASRAGVMAGQTIELAFPRLAAVSGTASLPEGSLPSAMVVSLRELTSGLERVESFGGAAGRWGFDELPPGRYRISVRSIEGAGAIDVDLAAGQERGDVVVELQPRVIVSIVMRDLDTDEPLAEVDVAATDRDASLAELAAEAERGLAMGNRERRSDASGRLVIRRPPGLSRALLLHADFERGEYGPHFATIDVPHGVERAELTLYLVRNRLPQKTPPVDLGYSYAGSMFCDGNEVDAVDEGGLAQQAGLRVGDEIVAIDGHDIRGPRCYLREWLARVAEGQAVELTLARGVVLRMGAAAG